MFGGLAARAGRRFFHTASPGSATAPASADTCARRTTCQRHPQPGKGWRTWEAVPPPTARCGTGDAVILDVIRSPVAPRRHGLLLHARRADAGVPRRPDGVGMYRRVIPEMVQVGPPRERSTTASMRSSEADQGTREHPQLLPGRGDGALGGSGARAAGCRHPGWRLPARRRSATLGGARVRGAARDAAALIWEPRVRPSVRARPVGDRAAHRQGRHRGRQVRGAARGHRRHRLPVWTTTCRIVRYLGRARHDAGRRAAVSTSSTGGTGEDMSRRSRTCRVRSSRPVTGAVRIVC